MVLELPAAETALTAVDDVSPPHSKPHVEHGQTDALSIRCCQSTCGRYDGTCTVAEVISEGAPRASPGVPPVNVVRSSRPSLPRYLAPHHPHRPTPPQAAASDAVPRSASAGDIGLPLVHAQSLVSVECGVFIHRLSSTPRHDGTHPAPVSAAPPTSFTSPTPPS